MTIKMQLHNPKLEFFPPYHGRGRIHARFNGTSRYDKSIDFSQATMCGQPVTDDMKPMDEREVNVQELCGRCYSTLRTYSVTQVQLVDDGK